MTEEGRINIPPEELIPSLASESQASRRYAAKMLGNYRAGTAGPLPAGSHGAGHGPRAPGSFRDPGAGSVE